MREIKLSNKVEKVKYLYFDSEFTGLTKDSQFMSVAFIGENNEKFYAEFNDYDPNKLNDWLFENIFKKLLFNGVETFCKLKDDGTLLIKDNSEEIRKYIIQFFNQYSNNGEFKIVIVSDCLSYDWVLLNDLIADYTNGYPVLPDCLFYIPEDISTTMFNLGIDPDISREDFLKIDKEEQEQKHNCLYDATIIRAIHINFLNFLDKK